MTIRFVFASEAWENAQARWAIAQIAPLLDAPWSEAVEGSAAAQAATAGDPLVWIGARDRAPAAAAAVVVVEGWPRWDPASVKLGQFDRVPLPCAAGSCPPATNDREFPAPWLRSIAWMLAREEETLDPRRDQWECYSGTYSRLHELGVLERPLVNELVSQLRARLDVWARSLGAALERVPRWKNGARFAVALTHDVDDVSLHSLAQALRLLSQARSPRSYAFRGGLKAVARALAARGSEDPYWTFDRWAEEESRRGFRSTFYVFAPSPSKRHEYDAHYSMSDRVRFERRTLSVKELWRELASRGFEIGLHGSYLSHRSASELARQRSQIESAIGSPLAGTRQHFLRWDVNETPRAQLEARFAYDATLGYNEAPGFRAGIAAPFQLWDGRSGDAPGLLEVPTTCMDGSLFRSLALDSAAASARVIAQLETVESVGGLAVLLWHPNAAAERVFPGWWPPYVAALEHLAARGAWVSSAGEIASAWQERRARLRS